MRSGQGLTKRQILLRRRIVKLTYEAGESHLGSALSAVDLIEAVYEVKDPFEKFVLSCGHAASALYVVLEYHGHLHYPNLKKLGVHPDRNDKIGISVSSGSLGQGLPIAVGLALSNRLHNVYCLISDGECAEGSVTEALRIATENNLKNLVVIANINGYAAYRTTNPKLLASLFRALGWKVSRVNGHNLPQIKKALKSNIHTPTLVMSSTQVNQLPFLEELHAHYHKMSEGDYQLALKQWPAD